MKKRSEKEKKYYHSQMSIFLIDCIIYHQLDPVFIDCQQSADYFLVGRRINHHTDVACVASPSIKGLS